MRRAEQVSVGEQLPERTVHVDRARLVQYAGASLDRNPIHWDERFARSVGLPDVLAHGMFTMGAAVQVVVDWAGDAGRVVEYSTRFTKPVVVPYDGGADLRVSAVVRAVDAEARRATVELTATASSAAAPAGSSAATPAGSSAATPAGAGTKVLGRALAVVALD